MLIVVTVLPIALDRVQEMPEGAPEASGLIVAAVTLAIATRLALWVSGALRLWSSFIGIGCVSAALSWAYDGQGIFDTPRIGISEVDLLGFGLTTSAIFWALVPVFVVVMLADDFKNIGDNVTIQQASVRVESSSSSNTAPRR